LNDTTAGVAGTRKIFKTGSNNRETYSFLSPGRKKEKADDIDSIKLASPRISKMNFESKDMKSIIRWNETVDKEKKNFAESFIS